MSWPAPVCVLYTHASLPNVCMPRGPVSCHSSAVVASLLMARLLQAHTLQATFLHTVSSLFLLLLGSMSIARLRLWFAEHCSHVLSCHKSLPRADWCACLLSSPCDLLLRVMLWSAVLVLLWGCREQVCATGSGTLLVAHLLPPVGQRLAVTAPQSTLLFLERQAGLFKEPGRAVVSVLSRVVVCCSFGSNVCVGALGQTWFDPASSTHQTTQQLSHSSTSGAAAAASAPTSQILVTHFMRVLHTFWL